MLVKWTIEPVGYEAVLPLRRRVLRPGLPVEDAVFPGDGEADALHLALRMDGEIRGVVSLFNREPDGERGNRRYQLRGMATDAAVRGVGLGTQLLLETVTHAKRLGIKEIWCNARIEALSFYVAHGFVPVGEEFDIAGVGMHRRAVLDLES